ncbi:hypothetical protein SAMN05216251_12722 [Actinacidiphila alni]|uniref:Uncharacterized protein n=1 Tax=Actinacidiphila alni TaxID=380248 RepID=A0A1I2LB57_9ACTN|nr:hypothetical protein [Actinacidiphila alni]SFF74727.1 hypothetical protein SAMN05216251_12722 [Actinacidiphila alni]
MTFIPNPETKRLYQQGLTLVQVAARLGVNDRTVSRHLKALGVPTRRGGGGRPTIDTSTIDWYQVAHEHTIDGDSTIVLGERYGVHPATVHRHLTRLGVNRSRDDATRLRSTTPRLLRGQVEGLASDLDVEPAALEELLRKHRFLTD